MGPEEDEAPTDVATSDEDAVDDVDQGGDPACHLHLENERGY